MSTHGEERKSVYVVGHKNPDTDSVCTAIAYAYLKNKLDTDRHYVAKAAGQLNEETEFVLDYYKVPSPAYMPNVGAQVRDLQLHKTPGADVRITVREAWNRMSEAGTMTLPLTDADNKLKGLITVGDIAKHYMNSQAQSMMAEGRTQYRAIAQTLDGHVVAGNEHGYFVKGKALVGAAQPEKMTEVMQSDDLVILSNREDAQILAIEAGASCLVISMGVDPSEKVVDIANAHDCVIIVTPLDTYQTARLIEQSIPVERLMTRDGIMSFHQDDYLDDIKETMGRLRHRDFPVLNRKNLYLGTISRRNLINVEKKKLILVDHSEVSQAVDNLEQAEILEIIDHHRIGTVETLQPIVFRGEPVGCTATIVASIYKEKGEEIPAKMAGLLCAAIISDTLMFRSPTCTARDVNTAEKLAEIAGIDIETFAKAMFKAGSNFSGKSAEEIFYQDFKKFVFDGTTFGVGQISALSADSLMDAKARLQPILEQECGRNGMEMIFFMLTDILTENTELLYYGNGAESLLEESLGFKTEGGSCLLKGVVSRKKQLIPTFMQALQTN